MTTNNAETKPALTPPADPSRPLSTKKRYKPKKINFRDGAAGANCRDRGCAAGWEFAVRAGVLSESDVSRPAEVWASLVDLWNSGVLWSETIATLRATLIALVIGVPLGVV